jgi:hypothetical protein
MRGSAGIRGGLSKETRREHGACTGDATLSSSLMAREL